MSLFTFYTVVWQWLRHFPKDIGPIVLLLLMAVESSSFWLQDFLRFHLKPGCGIGLLLLLLTWCLVICLPNSFQTLIKVTSISVL